MYSRDNVITNLENLIDRIKNKNEIDNKWVVKEILGVAVKENKNFTKEVCENLYDKLDELDVAENDISFTEISNEIFYSNHLDGVYSMWTETAKNNLLLWKFENDDLYYEAKNKMIEVGFEYDLDENLHKTEVILMQFGTEELISKYCDEKNIDMEKNITERDIEDIKEYVNNIGNLGIEEVKKNKWDNKSKNNELERQ